MDLTGWNQSPRNGKTRHWFFHHSQTECASFSLSLSLSLSSSYIWTDYASSKWGKLRLQLLALLEIFMLIFKLAMCHHHFLQFASTIPGILPLSSFHSSHAFIFAFWTIVVGSCEISSGVIQINRCLLLCFVFFSLSFSISFSVSSIFSHSIYSILQCWTFALHFQFKRKAIEKEKEKEKKICKSGGKVYDWKCAFILKCLPHTHAQVNMHVSHTINHSSDCKHKSKALQTHAQITD